MKRKIDSTILSQNAATDSKYIDGKDTSWYIALYIPSLIQLGLFNQQTITITPTDLSHIKRSVCSKDVQQQTEWSFDLGVCEGIDLPIYVLQGF